MQLLYVFNMKGTSFCLQEQCSTVLSLRNFPVSRSHLLFRRCRPALLNETANSVMNLIVRGMGGASASFLTLTERLSYLCARYSIILCGNVSDGSGVMQIGWRYSMLMVDETRFCYSNHSTKSSLQGIFSTVYDSSGDRNTSYMTPIISARAPKSAFARALNEISPTGAALFPPDHIKSWTEAEDTSVMIQ